MADKTNPDVPPIPVPPVEAAPKVAKAPAAPKTTAAKAPAASKATTTPKAKAAAATPIPPLVDLAGNGTPAAAQPNPYAQPAQQNPYAQPVAGEPQPYAATPQTAGPAQGLSITSMILGIAGILFGGFIPVSVAVVITGHMASKSQAYAKPFWLTGIITGYIGIGIGLLVGLFWLAWVLLMGGIGAFSSYNSYNY